MTDFDAQCEQIYDERLADIARAKQAVVRAPKESARQHALLSGMLFLYASFEGGTKELFRAYFQHINTQNLRFPDIKPCYAECVLRKRARMTEVVQQHEKRIEITDEIIGLVSQVVELPLKIPTESNLSPKILKKLFGQMELRIPLRNMEDEKHLNHLLRLRNLVAHGERHVTIDLALFNRLSSLVINLLAEEILILTSSVAGQTWLVTSNDEGE